MLPIAALAQTTTILPYQASYGLYRNGIQLGTTELSLEREDKQWRWLQTSKAKGIYTLFTRKKPSAETRFSRLNGKYRLQSVLLTDEADSEEIEMARFDWNNRVANVLRKKKQRKLGLTSDVYSHQSVHLLSAEMLAGKIEQRAFYLYYKGRLVTSDLKYIGTEILEFAGRSIETKVIEHTIAGSDTRLKYYYDLDNPLAPIKLETSQDDKKTIIMLLKDLR